MTKNFNTPEPDGVRDLAHSLVVDSLISGTLDAIILTDENMKVIFWNRGAELTFGYTQGEIIGKSLHRLMPEKYRATHDRKMSSFGKNEKIAAQNMGDRGEITALRKNGEEFPALASIIRHNTEVGPIYGTILRDISLRVAAEKRKESALDEARDAVRSQRLFFSQLGHEIRTPLNAILGFSEILMKYPEKMSQLDVVMDYMAEINKAGERLLQLVDDMMAI